MSALPGLLTCLLLMTSYFMISESARKKTPQCKAAWSECSLLTADAIENFLQNKICENVKKSIECYTRHGCPEGEPHLRSLHKACGMMKGDVVRAERVQPGAKNGGKFTKVPQNQKKSPTMTKSSSRIEL